VTVPQKEKEGEGRRKKKIIQRTNFILFRQIKSSCCWVNKQNPFSKHEVEQRKKLHELGLYYKDGEKHKKHNKEKQQQIIIVKKEKV
jgi:hypothetical protein